jgi:tetratricopeptide (TPR) repeat protein
LGKGTLILVLKLRRTDASDRLAFAQHAERMAAQQHQRRTPLRSGIMDLLRHAFQAAIVIQLNPNFAFAFMNRGAAYNGKGQHDRAIQDYDQAIRLEPNLSLAFLNRGGAYADKGQHDRAIQDYDQAIRLHPSFAYAFLYRGRAYAAMGQAADAHRDFDQAILLNPNLADALRSDGVWIVNGLSPWLLDFGAAVLFAILAYFSWFFCKMVAAFLISKSRYQRPNANDLDA